MQFRPHIQTAQFASMNEQKTFRVLVTATGFKGDFALPEEYLAELVKWLADRCKEESEET